MSSVNYSIKHKGVKLVDAQEAWVKGKNGKFRLNTKYHFVGRVEMSMPNIVLTSTQGKQPSYVDDVSTLNKPVKKELVKHFYNEKGKRNKKTVAYFGVEKSKVK